jgi:hypothetical protein
MEAYLVIGVLMSMASLLSCKSVLECVQALMHVLSECSGCAGNCECVSLNYYEKRSAREVLMILLVLWSVGKPCLLILGPLLGEFVLGQPPQWTVVFVQVLLNHCAVSCTRRLLLLWPLRPLRLPALPQRRRVE